MLQPILGTCSLGPFCDFAINFMANFKSLSPFKIDKEDAQREIQKSLETWKKKEKEIKSFFQKFHKYKTKPLLEEENISHWSFCEGSNNYVDIHLLWSKKIIKTLKNVKVEKVKTALLGLKRFYSQISSVRPDFSNPYILECYNQTAKNYFIENATGKNFFKFL